jgi:hypothetical protein
MAEQAAIAIPTRPAALESVERPSRLIGPDFAMGSARGGPDRQPMNRQT